MKTVLVPMNKYHFICNKTNDILNFPAALEIAAKEDTCILLSKNSFRLIQSLSNKPITVFTEFEFEKYSRNLNSISQKIDKIPLFPVDEQLLQTISFYKTPTKHPAIVKMRWFQPPSALERSRLLYEIIDPRFYSPRGVVSRTSIQNILRHCGITYSLFEDLDRKVQENNPQIKRALMAWKSWYSPHFINDKKTGIIVPDPKAKYGVSTPRAYFIRHYLNLATRKWDATALFKITKLFVSVFVRIWSNTFDSRLFKYKCEAESFCRFVSRS